MFLTIVKKIRHAYVSKYKSNSSNDYWWWKMTLSCSKKIAYII